MSTESRFDIVREHVERSARIIEEQTALISTLERAGMGTRPSRARLGTMHQTQGLMIEHLHRLIEEQTERHAAVAQ